MTKTVEPLGASVLVLPDPDSHVTAGGVALPHNDREIGKVGKVVRVGDEVTVAVKKGDRVIFGGVRGQSGYTGRPMDIKGVRHLVISEGDLLGVDEDPS